MFKGPEMVKRNGKVSNPIRNIQKYVLEARTKGVLKRKGAITTSVFP